MATYKVKWTQNVQEPGQSPAVVSFKTDTTDVIWNQQIINQLWDSSGCYAGAKAQNGSLMGCSSVANWTGWNVDETQSDMRDVSINFGVPSAQQNLRFLVDYMNGTGPVNRQTFNWFGLRSGTAQAIKQAYDNLTSSSSISVYDPYSKQQKNVSITQTANSPLTDAFLTELKINDLIWVPYFIIREIEVYGLDSNVNGYTSINNTNTNTAIYTWDQIKPEDKTPAGQYYDEDLFIKGYKDITPINEDGVRWRFCCGVVLVPYYGKCSSTYNENDDTYTAGTNPDDGNVYGARQIFGATANDSGDYPVVLNTSNLNTVRLMVMTEVADATTDTVYYSTPTGIAFSGSAPSVSTLTADVYTLSNNFSITTNFNKFQSNSAWTTFWTNNNVNDSNFYKDQDFSVADGQTSPDLVVPATATKIDVSISDVYNDLPNAARYFLDGNGPNIYGCYKSSRVIYSSQAAFFPIGDLWATIASLGCYVADNTICAQNAPTGVYTGENNHLYLGYMSQSGITNGTMLQGGDIITSVQAGIDDIIQHTPYTPVDPRPGGGDGTDPAGPPTPSGKGEGKITGDTTTGHKTRQFGSGPISYYGLKETEVRELTGLLWSQTKDFYNAIQIAGRYNTSIFDYITSFKYYPSSLASMGFGVGSTSAIKIGTGAVLKGSNGNYQANKLTGFFSQFVWCSWSLSSYDFWYPNDAFLNYGPYMKISIYLPYAGTFDLDPQTIAANNPISQATISVRVAIDLNTGTLTYYVDADGVLILNKTVQFGIDLPLTGNDTIEQSKAILSSNYKSAQTVIGTVSNLISNVAGGNLIGTVETVASAFVDANEKGIEACLANRQIPTQVNSFGGTMSNITQGQDPYLTFYRQKIANPSNYGHAVGYLTESTQQISKLTGFTVCRNPDVSGINATQEEKNEIQSILTTGFYA